MASRASLLHPTPDKGILELCQIMRRLARVNLAHSAQERHGLFHFRHGKATVKLFAFSPCAYEAGGLQDSKMLRKVRFGNTKSRL